MLWDLQDVYVCVEVFIVISSIPLRLLIINSEPYLLVYPFAELYMLIAHQKSGTLVLLNNNPVDVDNLASTVPCAYIT